MEKSNCTNCNGSGGHLYPVGVEVNKSKNEDDELKTFQEAMEDRGSLIPSSDLNLAIFERKVADDNEDDTSGSGGHLLPNFK